MAIGGKPALLALSSKGAKIQRQTLGSKSKTALSKMVNTGFAKQQKDGSYKISAAGRKSLQAK